jgi:acetyl esterase/lipase
VDVTLNIVDEMYHVFPTMSSFLPEAREAVEEIGRFVQAMYPEDVDDLAGTPAIPSVATHPPS